MFGKLITMTSVHHQGQTSSHVTGSENLKLGTLATNPNQRCKCQTDRIKQCSVFFTVGQPFAATVLSSLFVKNLRYRIFWVLLRRIKINK